MLKKWDCRAVLNTVKLIFASIELSIFILTVIHYYRYRDIIWLRNVYQILRYLLDKLTFLLDKLKSEFVNSIY